MFYILQYHLYIILRNALGSAQLQLPLEPLHLVLLRFKTPITILPTQPKKMQRTIQILLAPDRMALVLQLLVSLFAHIVKQNLKKERRGLSVSRHGLPPGYYTSWLNHQKSGGGILATCR